MSFLNVEIKAKCRDAGFIRDYLLSNGAEFKGIDEQTDTYFNVSVGRLKLREGNIENNLIYYERSDQPGPKNVTAGTAQNQGDSEQDQREVEQRLNDAGVQRHSNIGAGFNRSTAEAGD